MLPRYHPQVKPPVPHFPEEDAKLRATNLTIRRGGNCPNSLEVLQQLVTDKDNVKLHLVSCLPRQDAPSTRRILSSFGTASGINFGHCIYRQDHTEAASSYVIRSRESDSRTIVNYNGLPEMTCDEFAAIVREFDQHHRGEQTWWHFEVRGRIPETTLACIHLLRQRLPNAKISVEVEKPGREGLSQLAAQADVVFYSRTWPRVQVCRRVSQNRILSPRVSKTPGESKVALQVPLFCFFLFTLTSPPVHLDCALGVQTGRLPCLRQLERVFTVLWREMPTKYQSLSEFQPTVLALQKHSWGKWNVGTPYSVRCAILLRTREHTLFYISTEKRCGWQPRFVLRIKS
ncbi:hypothetical protein VFPPC_09892 [Pochonia chlamydosporia 170]|uniref:Uncharacterized protein n=1 Tax=Pochonia chlamydosporia 170 TaxID=1380566 RepID=A0A179FD42_METCM|nr:hypothetical protein VFPPC_09892 [Pochonia chlamydosporia 170]OAQ63406.2 hypothetical protein VFPPC_09892 [Pochonia chlamydosporia 170]